jgi:hypothetical protein
LPGQGNESNVPEIDEESAASQALSDLAHHLLSAAAADVEAITHEVVTGSGGRTGAVWGAGVGRGAP